MTLFSTRAAQGSFALAVALAAGLTLAAGAPARAADELSQKSIESIMEYAWSLVPQQFTKPDGKTITVDKKKKDDVVVPVDVAREVIRVGRLSAHAQICNLPEDQVINFKSLMGREVGKKKWSDQQLLYITQLHLTTIMLLTGKIGLVEEQGDKKVVIDNDAAKVAPRICSADDTTKVKEQIAAYVKAGPAIATAAPATTGSAPAAAPAAAAATATPAPVAVKPAAEKK
jgi:hypothetical protein